MTLTRRSMLVLLAAGTAGTAMAEIAPSGAQGRALLDLAYARQSPRNRLDIHLPQGAGPFPWLLDMHGGGFRGGDKRTLPVPTEITDAGIAVVRMNYRLSQEALWPAQERDALAALDYLHRDGPSLGLMPDRMAMGGRSAGAFLALSTALTLVRQGAAPGAVVNFFGPTDLGRIDADMRAWGGVPKRPPADSPDSTESRMLGYAAGRRRAEATALSPVGMLRALPRGTPLPPLFSRHGGRDAIVPVGQAGRLIRAWRQVDPSAQIDAAILRRQGHGTAGFGAPAVQAQLAAFLARHLSA